MTCTSSGLTTKCSTNCHYTSTSYTRATVFDPRQSVCCAGLEEEVKQWQDEAAALRRRHSAAKTAPNPASDMNSPIVAPRHLIGKRQELAPDRPGPACQQGQRRGGNRVSEETLGWSSASQLTNRPRCMAVRMAGLGFACAALRQ